MFIALYLIIWLLKFVTHINILFQRKGYLRINFVIMFESILSVEEFNLIHSFIFNVEFYKLANYGSKNSYGHFIFIKDLTTQLN